MDDLLGQDWSAPAKNNPPQPTPYSNPILNYPGLRPSPVPSLGNGLFTQPSSRPSSTINVPPKSGTPANDSFATLLGRNTGKGVGGLSIQERQKQLLEEKRKQEAEQRQRYASQFGGGDAWEALGSGRGTPEPSKSTSSTGVSNGALGGQSDKNKGEAAAYETVEDILAGFNSAAPVDKSSHFPPPTSVPASGRATPAAASSVQQKYNGKNGWKWSTRR